VAEQVHQLTATLYLAAALLGSLGLALPSPRLARLSLFALALASIAHVFCFAAIHQGGATPALTQLSIAVSFTALIGTVFYLVLARLARLEGLVVLVAPLAFVSVFVAGLQLPGAAPASATPAGTWEHAHVILASAGLALLGLAGVAGLFYLAEHRRLKSKRPIHERFALPSLEALDRVNKVALAVGFPLLTLGVVTGGLWVTSQRGTFYSGAPHELWSAVAWGIYAVVVASRFATRQRARQAAAAAVGGFAFLLFAVIGLELFA
jgi:ABC-type transport system involved in cytochrome c biogenesis permease subunit